MFQTKSFFAKGLIKKSPSFPMTTTGSQIPVRSDIMRPLSAPYSVVTSTTDLQARAARAHKYIALAAVCMELRLDSYAASRAKSVRSLPIGRNSP